MVRDSVLSALIQMRVGRTLEENLSEAKDMINIAASKEADVVCLPEYFFVPPADKALDALTSDLYVETKRFLESVSEEYNLIVAGTVLERASEGYFNTCLIYDSGRLIGSQRKVHLVEREDKFGLLHGNEFHVFKSRVGTLAVLVCADVLYPEACRVLGLMGADIVLNPVASTYVDPDPTKEARPSLFVSRAFDNSYFLLKTAGVGLSLFGLRLVGRSLAAAPWGIIARASDENQPELILAELDMKLLHKLRKENYSLRKRVTSAYKPLLEGK